MRPEGRFSAAPLRGLLRYAALEWTVARGLERSRDDAGVHSAHTHRELSDGATLDRCGFIGHQPLSQAHDTLVHLRGAERRGEQVTLADAQVLRCEFPAPP